MALPTVYIETSIISYLRARPSALLRSAARQVVTRKWWDDERKNYVLVTSSFVLSEASDGDPVLAADRLSMLAGIPTLGEAEEIPLLAEELLKAAILPPTARLDALHICSAAFHRIDYLLTWNCTHIANVRILPRIRKTLESLGHQLPVICTSEEMLNDPEDSD